MLDIIENLVKHFLVIILLILQSKFINIKDTADLARCKPLG